MSGLVYEAHSPLSLINYEQTLFQTVQHLIVSITHDLRLRVQQPNIRNRYMKKRVRHQLKKKHRDVTENLQTRCRLSVDKNIRAQDYVGCLDYSDANGTQVVVPNRQEA